MFKDGRPLTRAWFVQAVRQALSEAGIDQSNYCLHSFRIGAATTAAANGIEDSVIQTLGRWQIAAYLQSACLAADSDVAPEADLMFWWKHHEKDLHVPAAVEQVFFSQSTRQ